jgi:hypothetical protein
MNAHYIYCSFSLWCHLHTCYVIIHMSWGSHYSILQANTHVNVHQDLKDVKLWEVCIITFPVY